MDSCRYDHPPKAWLQARDLDWFGSGLKTIKTHVHLDRGAYWRLIPRKRRRCLAQVAMDLAVLWTET